MYYNINSKKFVSSCIMFPFLNLKTKWLKTDCLLVQILMSNTVCTCMFVYTQNRVIRNSVAILLQYHN